MNNASFTESRNSTAYIYTDFSELDCRGTVTGIKFCYKIRRKLSPPYVIGTSWPIFSLSVMRRRGTSFFVSKVTKVYSRPTNSNMICTRPYVEFNYCCDHVVLDGDMEFEFPRPSLAIAITVLDFRASLLGWNSNFTTEYNVKHYKVASSPQFTNPNGNITLPNTSLVYEPFQLVQLELGESLYVGSILVVFSHKNRS